MQNVVGRCCHLQVARLSCVTDHVWTTLVNEIQSCMSHVITRHVAMLWQNRCVDYHFSPLAS
jgi:hypothetical protein